MYKNERMNIRKIGCCKNLYKYTYLDKMYIIERKNNSS